MTDVQAGEAAALSPSLAFLQKLCSEVQEKDLQLRAHTRLY